jgi:hypothetical protein
MKTIATPIGELALWLEKTYQVDINETIGKWEELTGMTITVSENEISHNEVESMTIVVDTAKKLNKKIPKTKTKDTCQHTFLGGQKVGEQCTTKPKNGAVFCSAHKPKDKDSIKSTSSTAKKSKKKEIKQMEKIDPEFESDSADKEVKATKEKKKKVVTPKKSTKKVSGDTDLENSDDEALMSEPEEIAKPLLLKKKPSKPVPVKKNTKKNNYNTDEEHIDKDLNLSDEE